MEPTVCDFVGTFEKYSLKHVFEYSHHTVTNNYKQLVRTGTNNNIICTTSTSTRSMRVLVVQALVRTFIVTIRYLLPFQILTLELHL